MGFFADVGPLQVLVAHQFSISPCESYFLSQHCRDHISLSTSIWNSILMPILLVSPRKTRCVCLRVCCSSSWNRLEVIEKGTKVRLKIVGTRVDATEIVRESSALTVTFWYIRTLTVCYWNNKRRSPRRNRVVILPSGSFQLVQATADI